VTRTLCLLLLLAFSGCRPSWARTVTIPVSSQAVPDVTGTWNTRWEEYVAVLFLEQQGANVSGNYTTTARPAPGVETTLPGKLVGRFDGNELRGTWDEGGDRFGRFRFVFSADGHAFEGTYGNEGSEDTGGSWTGTR